MTADQSAPAGAAGVTDPAGGADRSPLAGVADRLAEATARGAGRLAIAERPGWNTLNLRIDPAASAALSPVLGTELPTEPNTVAAAGHTHVLWLGPDEWLVLSPDAPGDLETRLRAAAGDTALSVVDVSGARVVIGLGGPSARDVLAHGCALDLDPARFPPGRCAQTRLALADVILVAPPDQGTDDFAAAPRFLVLTRSSFAPYMAGWLLDAATEYLTG